MKYSDINERHIYNVDFEPHRDCEFDRIHLAIVLKKNNDNRTCIVAPLTSDDNGNGVNKCNLGRLLCLPSNMQEDNSFIVYNQVRTVNHSRFMALKNDAREKVSCKIHDTIFNKIASLCMEELGKSLELEEKVHCYANKYIEYASTLLVNTAYDIKKALKVPDNEILLTSLQKKIGNILEIKFDYSNYISENDKKNDICNIINWCLNHSILNKYKEINLDEEGQAR
jgi:uncharacterized protein YifN (PemK superfamily)